MITRIRWSEVEKIALAQATASYLKLFPEARLLQALAAGQEVLPENRRRKITAKAEIPWIDAYLEKVASVTDDSLFIAAAELDRRAHTPLEKSKPQPQPSLSLVPSLVQELRQQAQVGIAEPNLNDVPLDDLMEHCVMRFFREKMEPLIIQRAESLLNKKMAAMLEEIQVQRGEKGRVQIVTPTQVKKEMRSKVLILGLLGQQKTTIKDQYGDKLDLTLVQADHNYDGLISLAKSHDLGIVMTRFVNHSQQNQVRDNAPHTIFVSGSTSDLSNILNSLIKDGTEKVKEHNFNNKSYIN